MHEPENDVRMRPRGRATRRDRADPVQIVGTELLMEFIGDLSAYNILVHHGRLVIIDVPQIVDMIGNPHGPAFLHRDVGNVGAWFIARGLAAQRVDELAADLAADARLVSDRDDRH